MVRQDHEHLISADDSEIVPSSPSIASQNDELKHDKQHVVPTYNRYIYAVGVNGAVFGFLATLIGNIYISTTILLQKKEIFMLFFYDYLKLCVN